MDAKQLIGYKKSVPKFHYKQKNKSRCLFWALVTSLVGDLPRSQKSGGWRVEGGSWRVEAKCARSVLEGGSEKITKKLQNVAKNFLRDFRKVPLE